jgi:hypothetical protein
MSSGHQHTSHVTASLPACLPAYHNNRKTIIKQKSQQSYNNHIIFFQNLHPKSSWIQQNQTSNDDEWDSEEGDEGRKLVDNSMESFSNFIKNGKKISGREENLYAESLVQIPCEKVFWNK